MAVEKHSINEDYTTSTEISYVDLGRYYNYQFGV